ncbi:hypothetical protein PV10_04750 [Exophiala mesophila]|uniref:Uncharacterized protein n=1 Tax=Exophiala mesophila TaxID=212818 RepID=A0A0D1WW16_EXOME|nr:uncharacterized protein PV10_04750 [Exophiala mesophila]KIV93540.1 hypothetical protein PV10_04750 [Exophiala mesophila]
MSRLPRSYTPSRSPTKPRQKESLVKIATMDRVVIKEADMAFLVAAIQNSVGTIQVDAEGMARQLGMSLSTIPPKFSALRRKYHIDIKVLNSGALQRNRANTPKKAKVRSTPELDKAGDTPSCEEESPVPETGYTQQPAQAQHYPGSTHEGPTGFL